MYDLFFLSYFEPHADENWANLKERFSHARRVNGIKGIDNAHRFCAEQSFTSMFWTVDADTVVDGIWTFDYQPPSWDRSYLHLWHSRNPVNGLEYGYGAVKLWPKKSVLSKKGSWIDYTCSFEGIKILTDVIATTRFNSSPYETWKSAFREAVKLSNNLLVDPTDRESRDRLEIWTSRQFDVDFASWAIIGAQDGVLWHRENQYNVERINDFAWLKKIFVDRYTRSF